MYKGVVTFVVRSLRTMSTAYHQEQKQPFLKFDQLQLLLKGIVQQNPVIKLLRAL
jgi:hypothetical protein